MACDLLKKGWNLHEVNARLGHKPSSDEIDRYVNFLAIDRHRPKKKVEEFQVKEMKRELEESRSREKVTARRLEEANKEVERLGVKVNSIEEKFDTLVVQLKERHSIKSR